MLANRWHCLKMSPTHFVSNIRHQHRCNLANDLALSCFEIDLVNEIRLIDIFGNESLCKTVPMPFQGSHALPTLLNQFFCPKIHWIKNQCYTSNLASQTVITHINEISKTCSASRLSIWSRSFWYSILREELIFPGKIPFLSSFSP